MLKTTARAATADGRPIPGRPFWLRQRRNRIYLCGLVRQAKCEIYRVFSEFSPLFAIVVDVSHRQPRASTREGGISRNLRACQHFAKSFLACKHSFFIRLDQAAVPDHKGATLRIVRFHGVSWQTKCLSYFGSYIVLPCVVLQHCPTGRTRDR